MADGQLRRVLACTGLGIGLLTILTVVLYFMFYSAIGWGNSALAGCLIGLWMFAVGIACLGRAGAGLVRPAE